MILSYLYDLSEIEYMADIIVLTLKDYSFSHKKSFTVDEILDIKQKTNKKVFLSITPLFHEDELDDLKEIIKKLSVLDGFIYQDLGLVEIFNENNILNKTIYAPETFITNHQDKDYFKDSNINKFLISREITLNDIKAILDKKEDTEYMYQAFGYSMMFYSYRKHFKNYFNHYNEDVDLKNRFDISIKEENRNELYKAIEDNRGFRIYKDKILNAYIETKDLNLDYILLERVFISDEMYFDAIKLFKGELSIGDFYKKYNKSNFDKGYLYHEVGLLKGE